MSQVVREQDKQVIDVSEACYDEIRKKLVAAGTGGTIIERGGGVGKIIDVGEVVIRTGYAARHQAIRGAASDGWRVVNIYELHERMTGHLFPAYSSTDERFLALGLCGEAGELANMIKKRWRDGVDLSEEIRDEIADVRVYLELVAKCFGIEGDKLDQRVLHKLHRVVEKHKLRLNSAPLTEEL